MIIRIDQDTLMRVVGEALDTQLHRGNMIDLLDRSKHDREVTLRAIAANVVQRILNEQAPNEDEAFEESNDDRSALSRRLQSVEGGLVPAPPIDGPYTNKIECQTPRCGAGPLGVNVRYSVGPIPREFDERRSPRCPNCGKLVREIAGPV